MTDLREIAQDIANAWLTDVDYSAVYEHADTEKLSEEQLEQVHDMIRSAKAVLPEWLT